jgi:hypothetical protein
MNMNRTITLLILIISLSVPPAGAQFLGQLSPAPTVSQGEALAGAYLGVYEDAFSIFGQLRYGVARYFDMGLKMGMMNWSPGYGESNAGLTVGGDLKYWFMEQVAGDPLDVSVAMATEYLNVSDFSIFSLGGNVIASYEIKYAEGKSVTPYGRLNVRWERQSFPHKPQTGEKGSWSDDEMDVALTMGAELKISSDFDLIGELQIDDNVGFIAGVSYSIF